MIRLLLILLMSFSFMAFNSSNRVIESSKEIELSPLNEVSVFGDLILKTNNLLKLEDAAGGEYVSLKAPSALAGNLSFTLPSLDGAADECLKTSGAGVWSFADCLAFIASNDNRLLRTNTAGPSEIQESPIIVDDVGNISSVANITMIGTSILRMGEVAAPVTPSVNTGDMFFDSTEKKLASIDDAGLVTIYGAGGGGGASFENVAVDPSFEDDVSNVTCTVGTCTQETSTIKFGDNSLKIALSAESADVKFCFDNTSNIWLDDNAQSGAFIKTTLASVEFCYFDDTNENNCVAIPDSNKWENVNSIGQVGTGDKVCGKIKSTSETGDIFVDGLYLGPVDVFKTANLSAIEDFAEETLIVGAVTTPPTKGTITRDVVRSTRVGSYLIVDVDYIQTAAGGLIGNGVYLFTLPQGLSIDTSRVSTSTTVVADQNNNSTRIGEGVVSRAAAGWSKVSAHAYDSTRYFLRLDATANDSTAAPPVLTQELGDAWQSGSLTAFNDNVAIRLTLRIPINGFLDNAQNVVTPAQSNLSDWVTYPLIIGAVTTPPTEGAGATNVAYWRRVGDSMEIRFEYAQGAAGTTGTGTYLFPIPIGYTIDLNKVDTIVPSNGQSVGGGAGFSSNSGLSYIFNVYVNGDTDLSLFHDTATVSSTSAALTGVTTRYGFEATVPIVGWDSDVNFLAAISTETESWDRGFNNLDNEGFEDGINKHWNCTASKCTTETAAPLFGISSLIFTPTAQNNEFYSDLKEIPEGLKGVACEARVFYTGGDENITAQVLDGNGLVLGETVLQSHGVSTYESVWLLCPSVAAIAGDPNKGDLKLRIYNEEVTVAAVSTWDNMYLGQLQGLITTTLPDIFSANITGVGIVTTENVDWINGNCTNPSTGKVRCTYNSGLVSNAMSCVVAPHKADGTVDSDQTIAIFSSSSLFETLVEDTNSLAPSSRGFNVTCQKQGTDALQAIQVYENIPKTVDSSNEFSFSVDGAGVVSNETPFDIISGNFSKGGAGQYNGGWAGSLASRLTVTPHCVGMPIVNSNSARTTHISISTLGTFNYKMFTGTTLGDIPTRFVCQFSGADYKPVTVQPILVNQVQTSVLSGVTTESCQINNSGTPTIDTASGLCESWVSSLDDNTTGNTTINFISGTFSSRPVCVCSALSASNDRNCIVETTGSPITKTIVRTANLAGTGVDSDLMVMCIGKR